MSEDTNVTENGESKLSTAEDANSTKADAPVSEPSGTEPEATYFDFLRHERVQAKHTKGIWTDLGTLWGGFWVRIRALHVHAVVVRREAAEQKVRKDLGLEDSDPIPPSEGIEINRATVTMALTGGRGRWAANDDQLAIATRNKWQTETVDADGQALTLVVFKGDEDPDQVRLFFHPAIEGSMPFLTTLIKNSRELQKARDEEIDRLGEDSAWGQHVKLDWRD